MIQERLVEAADRSMRYLEAGSGWPLVLLHAFPLSADMWRPQLERCPAGWRLLAPDLRGFGPQGGPAARTVDDMAGDVAAWLDALSIERAVIAGLSMGGYVAFALYRAAPERFTGIVLANTRAGADSAEGRAARDRMSALVREKGPGAVADEMLPKLLGKTSRESRPELADEVRRLIDGNSAAAIDGAIQAMKERPDSAPLLPRIGRPALVISGDEDTIIPAGEADEMARGLPRAYAVVIPRAGHLSNLEAPDAFSGALADFAGANL